jgi:hypothetical protein
MLFELSIHLHELYTFLYLFFLVSAKSIQGPNWGTQIFVFFFGASSMHLDEPTVLLPPWFDRPMNGLVQTHAAHGRRPSKREGGVRHGWRK